MITGSWRGRRLSGVLAAGVVGAAALAGCGSEVEGQASAGSPSSSPAAPSSAGSPAGAGTGASGEVEDLSAGLLPAEAFGPGASVTPITAEQLQQQQGQLGGLGLQDVQIAPESCAPAVQQVQPGLDDLTGLGAQSVMLGSTVTAEVLAQGEGLTGAVDQLAGTVGSCPRATITAPQIGTADVTFAPLQVPDLGDGAAGLTMTLSLPGPGGQPLTVPVLLGMVADGDRLLSLTTTDPTTGPDPAAFAQLLQDAFEHQADALD